MVELAPEGAATARLKRRHYADKDRALGHPIHLTAVELSKDTRNVASFEVEHAERGRERTRCVRRLVGGLPEKPPAT